ncbi:hypothetical protein AA0473_0309 [Acetobacter orleanensis NRIC 0473]|nr:hypothetical protein Abol_053_018 [Acetobacter orleanensis JCM 7639]GBR23157.1 hypothetical protein AA0473_0309 [Acetobacter orleanensis NRIC 0473]
MSVIGPELISVERVCGMPIIEDTAKDRHAYKQQALAAVKENHDQAYVVQKKACIARLAASY